MICGPADVRLADSARRGILRADVVIGPYGRGSLKWNLPGVDKPGYHGIMLTIGKGWEEKSTRLSAAREPRLVERGAREVGEHGLGAELSIGRQLRVRPLTRFGVVVSFNQNWGPRKSGWLLWGRGNAKLLVEFSACRKWSSVACALTRIKVVPR